jgi:hypothetical protein
VGSEAASAAAQGATVRIANDRIRAAAERLRFEDDQRVPFLCECSDARCLAAVMVTLAAYAALREDRRHFLLVAGHENLAEERVLDDRCASGYIVVERVEEPTT